MRADAPVFAVPGTDYFLVTRYDLVSDISKSYDEWSSNSAMPPSRSVRNKARDCEHCEQRWGDGRRCQRCSRLTRRLILVIAK